MKNKTGRYEEDVFFIIFLFSEYYAILKQTVINHYSTTEIFSYSNISMGLMQGWLSEWDWFTKDNHPHVSVQNQYIYDCVQMKKPRNTTDDNLTYKVIIAFLLFNDINSQKQLYETFTIFGYILKYFRQHILYFFDRCNCSNRLK